MKDSAAGLQALGPEWKIQKAWTGFPRALCREFRFPDFRQALDFVNRVGEAAESRNHHPEILLSFNTVRIELWTHDTGDIGERDFALAALIEGLQA